ncbi:hypothetical protein B6E66_15845 [Streptomyces maremycinicus]|nr:hypothetical protein B6E66_15845 [Streptomyces sp. B9173]
MSPTPLSRERSSTPWWPAALRKTCGWDSLGANGWPISTYVRYCALLDRWALEESGRLGRRAGIDEIERWLFRP